MTRCLNRGEWGWVLYDFGNSAYALLVMTLFYPLFFSSYVAPGASSATAWGLSVSVSILLAGIVSPLLGAYTDQMGRRKSFFTLFGALSIIGIFILPFAGRGGPWLGAAAFVAVNSAFGIALSLYDSFVVVVPSKKTSPTMLSGVGWSLGYVGGLACLGLAYLVAGRVLPSSEPSYVSYFLVAGIFFFVCAIPTYLTLPNDDGPSPGAVRQRVASFRKVWLTLKSREHRHLLIFLLAMYFVMDGVTTIVYFTSLYAQDALGFNIGQVVWLLVIVQLVAIPATVGLAWLADRWGEVRTLVVSTCLWVTLLVMIYFATSYGFFMIISVLTGFAVGSSPAIARGYLAKKIPPDQRAEFFGFNTFVGRMAALLGPLAFGVVASAAGMRAAVWSILPFFLAGLILLSWLWRQEAPRPGESRR
jgi:UMF1 family MFS transporter